MRLLGPAVLCAVFHAGNRQLLCLACEAQAKGMLRLVLLHIGGKGSQIALDDGHLRLGGIVLILHSGGTGSFPFLQFCQNRAGQNNLFAQHLLHLLLGDVAGAQ